MRGEIFELHAPRPSRGHEQSGSRYGVVVQSDQLPLSTWLVAPTSTLARAASFRPEVDVAGTSTRVLAEQTNAMLENALSQDLGTATYLVCPQDGITGVTGTTADCQANYGYPAGPCPDPLFDDQGRESEVLRRCTLLVGIQKISGVALDLQILRVTPPA